MQFFSHLEASIFILSLFEHFACGLNFSPIQKCVNTLYRTADYHQLSRLKRTSNLLDIFKIHAEVATVLKKNA